MRLRSIVLGSTSAIAIALVASPAAAQVVDPAAPPDPTVEAQEGPADPEAGSPQTDDAAQTATGLDEPVTDDATIVVTGLRRSLRSAQNIKRNSEQIVDAIVAEDIGKLPDVTVAETAARIPGIQVDRARGEAAGQVLLRGLPDVTTTYNGRDIFTAETRSVALGDFPAGGIAAIEAFKSTTANQIEGGIGGLINVRARRPFDFQDREISGGFRYAYAYQSRNWDPNGNLLLSDRWDLGDGSEFGALINFSYTQMRYLDSARWNSGNIGTFTSTDGETFRAPEAVGIFYGEGDRRRPSINGALQYRVNPDIEFYIDGLWQGYRDKVSDRMFENRLWGGGAQFTNLETRPGTNFAESVTVDPDPPGFLFQGATYRKTDTYQIAAGGRFDVGRAVITADVARTDSKFDMSLLSFDMEPVAGPNYNVNFDVDRRDGGVEFDFINFDPTDINNFRYLGFFDRAYIAAGDDWQFRTDVEYDTGMEFLPEFEAGIRYTTRDAYQENGERYCATWMGNCGLHQGPTPLSAIPIDFEVFQGGFRGSDIQDMREWIVPTYDGIRDNVEVLREIAGFAPGDPPMDRVFTADEQTLALYGQVGYAFDAAGIPIDGKIGLRIANTKFDIETAETVSREYTDYLPHASLRARLTDQVQLRLSATKTRTRPTFFDMRPTILGQIPPCFGETPVPGPETCFVGASGGNQFLEPATSTNFDASFEYFFAPNGYASLALFRRDFKNFITSIETRLDHPELGEDRIAGFFPQNTDGSIKGFELSAQTFFDFLPYPLSGFGVQANLTHLDDSLTFPTALGDLDQEGRIIGVSKWTYNLVGMYERGPITARLSYNRRSRWNTAYAVDFNNGGYTGEYIAATDRLDWSSSYTPFENLTLEFNYSNILGNPFRNFRRFTPAGDVYPRDVRHEESIISFGARFRM